jgi:hypothetical protein
MPRSTKRAELERWIGEHAIARIGESEFMQLSTLLAPISESYLRTLVRSSGVPLDPMVEGVRQGNLDELETSLLRMLTEYERRDAVGQRAVRRLVITAKDHAKLAARSPKATAEKRAEKEEAILWLTIWLENPPLFADWVRVRRVRLH